MMINGVSTTDRLLSREQASTQPTISEAQTKAKNLFALVGRTDSEKFKLLEKIWTADSKNRVPSELNILAQKANPKPTTLSEPTAYIEAKEHRDAKELRIELTKLILESTPTMAGLSSSFAKIIKADISEDKIGEQLQSLISINLQAHHKTEGVKGNLFFSIVHLASLSVKTRSIDNLSAALTSHADATTAAKEATKEAAKKIQGEADQNKVDRADTARKTQAAITKPLLRDATKSQLKGHIKIKLAYMMGFIKSNPNLTNEALACRQVLKSLPKSITSQAGWANVEKYMENYIQHTHGIQGEPFKDLLLEVIDSLPDLLKSFRVYSNLDPVTQDKMSFQRELWNVGFDDTSAGSKNMDALGVSIGHAKKMAQEASGSVPDVLLPGNQLAICMNTPIRTTSGNIKNITVVSCVGPALDSPDQPEFPAYVSGTIGGEGENAQALKTEPYTKAFKTIKSQVLEAAENNPQSKRVVLSAIGLNSFLSGLHGQARIEAIRIGTEILADLATELRKKGKTVIFTDNGKSSPMMDEINKHLGQAPLKLAGSIPGDWIEDDDLILNAWDPHSLVGNKLALDASIDGFIGRNTLLHFLHALYCAAKTQGVRLA